MAIQIKLIIDMLILVNFAHTWRYYASLRSINSTRGIELNARAEWWLHQNGQSKQVQLLGDSLITQHLLVLNFKNSSLLKVSVVLMQDSMKAADWRLLRVYLQTHRSDGS